jgi:hypothetical protein
VDTNELLYAQGVLTRLALAASEDRDLAQHVRQLVVESGILRVFGEDEDLNLLDILEAGGAALLRERLNTLPVPRLKQLIAVYQFDPEKTTTRWRNPARFVEFLVARAVEMWEEVDRERVLRDEAHLAAASQPRVPSSSAAWML